MKSNPKKSKRVCKLSAAERKAWGKRMQAAKKNKSKVNPRPKTNSNPKQTKTLIPGTSLHNNIKYWAREFVKDYAVHYAIRLPLQKVIRELKNFIKRDGISAWQAYKNEVSFLKN